MLQVAILGTDGNEYEIRKPGPGVSLRLLTRSIYIFMAAWCNVEIHNDVDNQQFSSLKFSVWEAVRVLSQHNKSVMLPRAVYLDESCLFTSTSRRTLLPFTAHPRLACPSCKPDSFFLPQCGSGRTQHGWCHLLSFPPD